MATLMTEKDIIRLGRANGMEFSAAERFRSIARLNEQLSGFSVLDNVNTDGVTPMFGCDGDEKYKVRRCGE